MRTQIKLMAVCFSAVVVFFIFSSSAYSAIEAHSFDTDLERQRYQSFIEEMRCPKCQNQNLAGSDSAISTDLRREIYGLIKAGKADQEIVDFMVSRYGEFILYRPRVSPVTYVLWAAPAVLLIAGIVMLLVMLRQRRRLALVQSDTSLTTDEQARLNALLTDAKNDNLSESSLPGGSETTSKKSGDNKAQAKNKNNTKNK